MSQNVLDQRSTKISSSLYLQPRSPRPTRSESAWVLSSLQCRPGDQTLVLGPRQVCPTNSHPLLCMMLLPWAPEERKGIMWGAERRRNHTCPCRFLHRLLKGFESSAVLGRSSQKPTPLARALVIRRMVTVSWPPDHPLNTWTPSKA